MRIYLQSQHEANPEAEQGGCTQLHTLHTTVAVFLAQVPLSARLQQSHVQSHTFTSMFGFSSSEIVFPAKPFTKMDLGPCDKVLHISLHAKPWRATLQRADQAGCLLERPNKAMN
jgi:hypothetical protein